MARLISAPPAAFLRIPSAISARSKNRVLDEIAGCALRTTQINGRITMSGYEGSELLVGSPARRIAAQTFDMSVQRLCRELNGLPNGDREWLEAHGVTGQVPALPWKTTSRPWPNMGPISQSARLPLSRSREGKMEYQRFISPI